MQEAERPKMATSCRHGNTRCYRHSCKISQISSRVSFLQQPAVTLVESVMARESVSAGMPSSAKVVGRPISFLLNERGQRVDTGGGFPVTALGCDAPDILSKPRKPRKPRRTRLVDVAVQNGMDHRQARSMVAVGVSAELMLDLMRLKIRDLADLQHAVLCHGGRPRQLRFWRRNFQDRSAKCGCCG